MRLRLAHTLSLTLLAFAGVAVLALGGLTAWQLRNGFGEYLASRDVVHFERFLALLEARLAVDGGTETLLAGRMDLRGLLDELHPRPARPAGPASPPGALGPPGRPGPPGTPAPQRGFPDAFHERVQVLALNGEVLMGRRQIERPFQAAFVERPVNADGQMVAVARMRPAPLVRTGAEARFLRDQYLQMAGAALGLMVLALLTATWLARRWTRPLFAVQRATQRLAQGELSIRVPDGPALAGRSDEIGDVMRNVNRMAEGLQQLEGTRRRWLANISHELRTPLTVLRGDVEALRDGVRPLGQEAVAVLHEEVLRLNRLVEDLHLLAISDLQTLPCHMAPDDALDFLARLVRRYERRAREAGLSLQWQGPPGVTELAVHWDARRMEQLVSNLLENSLRYTEAPGEISLLLEQHGPRVTVVVEDTAPGVPPAMLPMLFEPLYRSDAARVNQPGGSGLGLAICAVIAKAHGGQVSAMASAKGGLRIQVTVPRVAGDGAASRLSEGGQR